MGTVPLGGSRILVLGCPGSGKSTLALKLQAITGLPLFHLDNLWWRPDRTHISREAFDRKLAELLAREAWILDGDYSRTWEVRIRACDTVILLDYDRRTCMAGIRERVGKARPDMPWTESVLDPELAEMTERWREEKRPVLLDLLARYPDKRQIVLRSRREAEEWLNTLE